MELRVPKSVACRTAQVREQLRPFDPLSRRPELVEGMTGGSSLGHNGTRARDALRVTVKRSGKVVTCSLRENLNHTQMSQTH